jgi:uncharacterized membrane protein
MDIRLRGYSFRHFWSSTLAMYFARLCYRLESSAGNPPLAAEYRKYWKYVCTIAVLMPFGYILVLFAMRMAPISHVAPVREMSMIIGTYFGIKYLHEGHAQRRIFASALIATGVIAIAVG